MSHIFIKNKNRSLVGGSNNFQSCFYFEISTDLLILLSYSKYTVSRLKENDDTVVTIKPIALVALSSTKWKEQFQVIRARSFDRVDIKYVHEQEKGKAGKLLVILNISTAIQETIKRQRGKMSLRIVLQDEILNAYSIFAKLFAQASLAMSLPWLFNNCRTTFFLFSYAKTQVPLRYSLPNFEWATKLNRYFLEPLGLWPTQYHGKREFYATLRARATFLLTTFVCTVPIWYTLITSDNDLMLFLDNISYALPSLITEIKFVILYKHRKLLFWVLNMMAKDWAKSKTHQEKSIMRRQANICRVFGVYSYVIGIIQVTLVITLPQFGIALRYVPNVTEPISILPLPVYNVHYMYEKPYYEIFFVLQLFSVFLLTFTYIGIDHFLGILIFHVCGQLQNLQVRFANIKSSENFERVLRIIVEDHIRLISAVNAIEHSFTLLLFFMFFYFLMFACIYAVLLLSILTESGFTFRLLFTLSILTHTFIQTFFYCIAGQILVTQFSHGS
ncbi:uncharacterized protein LOC143186299 [Calliopsis andreniformis]|uniref:uncharacterized protein LOC143186299 n=1 Tax=Calliopsis andreniformis TaxID=337506 RepID=UPI003FCE894C